MVGDISSAQLKCIKVMVRKLNVVDADAMVLGFTGMRTKHVSEMRVPEGVALIKHLKALDPDEAKADVMRKKIIAMAYERAGLGRTASKAEKYAVVNWLDGWCKQFGYKHKGLNAYTLVELPKLVTQFEFVLNDLLIKI